VTAPTYIEVRNHVREHFGLTMSETLEVLRTPLNPAGMRDEFALAAITGTLPGAAVDAARVKEYAEWAYKMADAMMEARNANR